MGVKCYCCGHPERDVIDAALVAGQSMRSLSKKYGCSVNSVMRHRENHLSPALAAVAAQRKEEAASTLVAQVRTLVARADELYTTAAKDGRSSAALAALKEMRGALDLLGRATGELKDASPVTVVNVQASEEWQQIRAVILQALVQYPVARQAVAERLLKLEAHNP